MRRSAVPVLLATLGLIAAGCTGSEDSAGPATETSVVTDETPTTEPATTTTLEEAVERTPGRPIEGFDYSTIDYDLPVEQSALRGNRADPSFPPPVIDPSLLIAPQRPDGIFPIDLPTFAPIDELDYEIADTEAVVAIEINGDARAFPIQLMIWHEIVNTEVGGVPVTVTFCPLCNSALTFDRRLGERTLDFGTSGELYQSALVMYDRQTESLWAHFTGRGLVGHYAGAELDLIPTQTVGYATWKEANPNGTVLTRDLSAPEQYAGLYGSNPYGGYDTEGLDPFGQFFIGEIDRTLLAKARIVGIVDESGPVAVRFDELAENPVIPITEGGRNLVVFYEQGLASPLDRFDIVAGRDVGQSGVFVPAAADGTALTFSRSGEEFVDEETGSGWNILGTAVSGPLAGEQLAAVPHTDAFWFAWATYQPGTVIVSP